MDAGKHKPTEQQAAFLAYFQANGYTCSRREAARKLGYPESTPQTWFDRDPEFVEWWTDNRERWFVAKLDVVHAALFAQATSKADGNPAAAKLLLERYDGKYMPKNRTEIDARVQGGLTINHHHVAAPPADPRAEQGGDRGSGGNVEPDNSDIGDETP